jgi:hypothetical protein
MDVLKAGQESSFSPVSAAHKAALQSSEPDRLDREIIEFVAQDLLFGSAVLPDGTVLVVSEEQSS